MLRTIEELRDQIDARPGLTDWEFAVRCYAVEILEDFIDSIGLTIWDDIADIENMTENTLLNGAKDWNWYSWNGNSLIWTQSISMRLFGIKIPPVLPEKLMDLQADALEQASQLILQTIRNEMETII